MTPETAIRARLRHPDYHAKFDHLGDTAELTRDLGLSEIDRWGIGCDMEEAHGFEFPGEVPLAWVTVGDVVRDFGAFAGVMA